jgi:NADPH:quinone reductase-like Zn-dependent oxidoreductase
MRAVAIAEPGPPDALQLRQVPIPEPGPGEARVKVAYVGMNPLDAMLRRQRLDWLPVTYPFVPGLEHSGVIDAVGPGVGEELVGRRVLSRTSFGGYADFSIARAQELIFLDERIGLKTGCAYRGCTYTAWHALHLSARLQQGERVLIHSAAGAIGAMLMQIARDADAEPYGLAGGPAKVQFAEQIGGCPVVDYLCEDWPARLADVAGDAGFAVIIDGNGGPNSAHNCELIAPLGRIIYIGATAGSYPEPVAIPALIHGSCSVGGMTLGQIEVAPGSEADRMITDKVASGAWQIPVTETVELEDVADLHRRLEARELMGRAVIRVGGG